MRYSLTTGVGAVSTDEIAFVPRLMQMAEDVGHIKEAVASLKDGQDAAVVEAKRMQSDITKLTLQGDRIVEQNDLRNGRIRTLEDKVDAQTTLCLAIQKGKELRAADIDGYNRRVKQEQSWLRNAWDWSTSKVVFAAGGLIVGAALAVAGQYDHVDGFLRKVIPLW